MAHLGLGDPAKNTYVDHMLSQEEKTAPDQG